MTLYFQGTAGQSFGAFCINGLNLYLIGEGLDYVGKCMHGGQIVVKPGTNVDFVWQENVIIGNTVMYGATGGHLFAAGQGGERFCVRNSGGTAVVEGIGDHGCEYMTGGTVVVLGECGRNFGAGMSGGTAFIYDAAKTFERRYNGDMIGIERIEAESADATALEELIERHARETDSPHAKALLDNWSAALLHFWKAVPHPEKAAAPTTAKRAERARPEVKPGDATVKVSDYAGKEPVGLKMASPDEPPAPTPAGS